MSEADGPQKTESGRDLLATEVCLHDGFKVHLEAALSTLMRLQRLHRQDAVRLESLYRAAAKDACAESLSTADRLAVGLGEIRKPERARAWEAIKHVLRCAYDVVGSGSHVALLYLDPFGPDEMTQEAVEFALKVTLKNGFRLDAALAIGYLDCLRSFAGDKEELGRLNEVAHGTAAVAELSGLAVELFCCEDGSGFKLDEGAKNLIMCALRQDGNDFQMVDPFGVDRHTRWLLGSEDGPDRPRSNQRA